MMKMTLLAAALSLSPLALANTNASTDEMNTDQESIRTDEPDSNVEDVVRPPNWGRQSVQCIAVGRNRFGLQQFTGRGDGFSFNDASRQAQFRAMQMCNRSIGFGGGMGGGVGSGLPPGATPRVDNLDQNDQNSGDEALLPPGFNQCRIRNCFRLHAE